MQAGTQLRSAGSTPYDVSLPEAGLDWERVGPLFEHYSIKLLGTVDAHWADCYQRVVAATPRLSRFRLDVAGCGISFTCRSTDGPVQVMAVLKILEEFLASVNQEACVPAARVESRPAPRSALAAAKSR